MHVDVIYQGQVKFEASSRGHKILTDQPLDNGGQDEGMTPPEWFLASLGSCIGFYAVKYLEARHLETTGLSISVTAQKTTSAPIYLDPIEIQIHVPIPLEQRHQQGLIKAADACLIHNTLTQHPTVVTHLRLPTSSATSSMS
jgi:uncharacterized OsmC-like protein